MFGLLGTFFWRASTSVSIHPFFTDMSRLHFQDEHVQEMGLMLQDCLPSAILVCSLFLPIAVAFVSTTLLSL